MTALGVGHRHFATGSDSGVVRVWPLHGVQEHADCFQPYRSLDDKVRDDQRGGAMIRRGMSFADRGEEKSAGGKALPAAGSEIEMSSSV